MREKNLSALHSNMDILISGLGVLVPFELKGNFADLQYTILENRFT